MNGIVDPCAFLCRLDIQLQLANLKHGLAKVLTLEHSKQPFASIVNTLSHALRSLERPIVDPFLHVLLVLCRIHRSHILVANLQELVNNAIREKQSFDTTYNKALNLESFCNDIHEIPDRIVLTRRLVVV